MVGVGEGLKLPGARGGEFRDRHFVLTKFFHEPGQETGLRNEFVRPQAGRFPGGLQAREVDLRGEVLPAGLREHVAAGVMTVIGAQRSVRPWWREKFCVAQSVINGEQFSRTQRRGGLTPPLLRRRANFGGESVWQHREQFVRQLRIKMPDLMREPSPDEVSGCS